MVANRIKVREVDAVETIIPIVRINKIPFSAITNVDVAKTMKKLWRTTFLSTTTSL